MNKIAMVREEIAVSERKRTRLLDNITQLIETRRPRGGSQWSYDMLLSPETMAAAPIRHSTQAGRLLTWAVIRDWLRPILEDEQIVYPEDLATHCQLLEVDDVSDMLLRDACGEPDTDRRTVLNYVASYEQNIQNMHPLIPPDELLDLATAFVSARTPPGREAPQPSEPVTMINAGPVSETPETTPQIVDTALVLLVLALGKICLRENRPSRQSVPAGGESGNGASPQPSKFPGIEYFTIATGMLGKQIGRNTIKHTWANLLAGLYYGQLGQPVQALEHVSLAGRSLQRNIGWFGHTLTPSCESVC